MNFFLKKFFKIKIKNNFLFNLLNIITLSFFFKFIKYICNFFLNIYLKTITDIYTNYIFSKYKNKIIKNNLFYPSKINPIFDLSIVIPAYVRSYSVYIYLKQALKALSKSLNNTNLKYEICIFDNCSIVHLKKLKVKYKNLKINFLRSKSVLNPQESWYQAVQLSKGRYVHIHSCDDFVDKNFYNSFEKIILNQSAEMIYTKAKHIYMNDIKNSYVSWYWNWPSINSSFFKPIYNFIENPMPSGSWICHRTFYEKNGVTANWINGLDLDLSIRLNNLIKKAYFSADSIIYYRTHEDMGNLLDNPRGTRELYWHLLKIRSIFSYKNIKNSKKKKIISKYIKNYCLTHSLLPRFYNSYSSTKEQTKTYAKLKKILLGKFKFFSLALYIIYKFAEKDKILIKDETVKKFFCKNIIYIFNPIALFLHYVLKKRKKIMYNTNYN